MTNYSKVQASDLELILGTWNPHPTSTPPWNPIRLYLPNTTRNHCRHHPAWAAGITCMDHCNSFPTDSLSVFTHHNLSPAKARAWISLLPLTSRIKVQSLYCGLWDSTWAGSCLYLHLVCTALPLMTFQPLWLSCCPSNTQGVLWPPALCAYFSLCVECSFPQTSAQLASANKPLGWDLSGRPFLMTGDWLSWFVWDWEVSKMWDFQRENQYSPGQTRMICHSTKSVLLIPYPLFFALYFVSW